MPWGFGRWQLIVRRRETRNLRLGLVEGDAGRSPARTNHVCPRDAGWVGCGTQRRSTLATCNSWENAEIWDGTPVRTRVVPRNRASLRIARQRR